MGSEVLDLGAWWVTGMVFFAVVLVVGILLIRRGYRDELEREERWSVLEDIGEQYEEEQAIVEFTYWLEKEHDIWLARREGFAVVQTPDARMRELVAEFMDSREEGNE